MRFHVEVTLHPGIADPQGATVARALQDLGFEDVTGVRIGRSIVVDLEGDDLAAAEARVDEMCRALLANPVMEGYTIAARR